MRETRQVLPSSISDPIYFEYLKLLLSGEKHKCLQLVHKLQQEGVGIRELYSGLFQRSLYEVGKLWENHRISVAIEHLATAISEFLIAEISSGIFSVERVDRSAIVSCVSTEYHQVGGHYGGQHIGVKRMG